MTPRLRKGLRVAAQVLLGIVIVVFVWRSLSAGLESSDFFDLRFSVPYLLLSWLFLLGYYLSYAGGTNMILKLLGSDSTLGKGFKLNYSSNLGKYIPGGVWPVLGRVALAPKLGLDRTHAATAMLFEAGMSTAGGVLVFFVSMAFGGFVPKGTEPWHWLALAGVVLVALHPAVFGRALGLAFRLTKLDAPVPRLPYVATLGLVVYYAATWAVAGLALKHYSLALDAGATGSFLLYAGFYAAAAIGGLVVLFAPGGLGVREGLLTLFLTPVVGVGTATVIGFSARIWSTLLELTLSGIALAMPVSGEASSARIAEKDQPDVAANERPAAEETAE